jgi:mono/diheme cytochrome c family protein
MNTGRVCAAILFAVGVVAAPARAQWLELRVPTRPKVDPEAVRAGGVIYQARCSSCHGEKGRGDGPVALYLWPRPRDLSTASYMLRTTASGELPTDEDLFRTITLGMAGTAMPAWGSALSVEQRWQVVFYIKTFAADLFGNPVLDPYQRVIKASKSPGGSRNRMIAEGRRFYEQAKCAECHGAEGRGDGGKGADLHDDRGFPSRPLDMHLKWKFKGGRTVEDFYTRLTTGLDGTPMPSYAKELTDEQRWELAYYSMSLTDYSADERSTPTVLEARDAGSLPASPDDPSWDAATEFLIPLSGQATFRPRWQTPAVTDIAVRAMFHEDQLVLRLAWDDSRADTLPGDPARTAADGWRPDSGFPMIFADSGKTRVRYPDAVEAMLPQQVREGGMLPHFVYGSPGEAVTLWRWRADGNVVSRFRSSGADRPPQPDSSSGQDAGGGGRWQDGRWAIVIHASLPAPPAGERSGAGRFVPVGFHVWDGGNGETGLRMALSPWYFLKLVSPVSPMKYLVVLLVITGAAIAEYGLVRWTRNCAARGELADYGVDPLQ